ncbi:porin family protein [Rhodohalobacter mucosus]|uniref:Outer membrane protein beta-barrel domain-containing protein n=1 Tax=Rhodohalobacter mucosus TaxID=2079485 RepID=A0A316TW03_9BACT|nr:porin family protein [Rhodohalobacter mucosus]PWN06704.1 hypothetical protein DDZ15_09320 [Rhodohalobacter mucosus]
MRTGIILMAFALFIPAAVSGQSNYIITDTTAVYGIDLLDAGEIENAKYIELRNDESIIRYTPDEVREYGFKDGRIYVSKQIQTPDGIEAVFFERLIQGNLTLYYYPLTENSIFYLERDSTLTPLYSERTSDGSASFRDTLRDLTSDCGNVSDAVNLVRYKKSSLSLLISRYNACELRPFPFVKYGIVSGFNSSSISLISERDILNQSFRDSDFIRDRSFSIGVFVDYPLFESDYSIYSGINYYENSYYSRSGTGNNLSEITVNLSSVEVPVMVRYAYPSTTFRPFFNIGFSYLANLKNESTVYESTLNNNTVEFNIFETSQIVSDHQLGVLAGIGTFYHLRYDRVIFLELRYKAHYYLTKKYLFEADGFRKNNLFRRSGIELVAGFNL